MLWECSMFYLCLFLVICCSVELYVLVKDAGKFASLYHLFRDVMQEKGFVHTMRKTLSFVTSFFLRKMPVRKNRHQNGVSLAIVIQGGYGDYLLIANWFSYLRERYIDENISVAIVYHKSSALSVFHGTDIKLVDVNSYRSQMYSVEIQICTFPILSFSDDGLVKKESPKLWNYIELLRAFNREVQFEKDSRPRLDSLMSARSIIQGKKRIQEPDFYNLLEMTEDYKYDLPVMENEAACLESFGVKKKCYILVHRGWDDSNGGDFNVKAWSLVSCGDMLRRLKEKFPGYKIVLFGSSVRQAPPSDGCDLNLIGKTDLEQVKVLLKYSVCLVDNEGGMVHLRHAVHGGASVVLFGATSPDFFGYSENINIRKNVCRQWCEWISADWAKKCIRTGRSCSPCMDAITTDDVIEAVGKVINSY